MSLGGLIFLGWKSPESVPLFEHIQISKWTERASIPSFSPTPNVGGKKRALSNYGNDLKPLADAHQLDWSYLMALTVLECSGERPCGTRFELKRYRQLKQVRDGKRRQWDGVKRSDLTGKSNAEIRALATSWGPFQIMGYHTITMSKKGPSVTVEDLTNHNALAVGVRWVSDNYGNAIRSKRFKDAFHIHNTGRPYPKVGAPRTYDPNYVSNGLQFIRYFQANEPNIEVETPVAMGTPEPN